MNGWKDGSNRVHLVRLTQQKPYMHRKGEVAYSGELLQRLHSSEDPETHRGVLPCSGVLMYFSETEKTS
ncbi:hypothetical protein B0A50_06474 [Salinomyces thailandicus]|uniref:Uncharacterized protein n=1 Tax=Salinomyces thailandicus TaxID=706561 RepID=A0A4U0TPI5_9PEZI|nr:hypothetical protein B0A50_06474 [Salinomyces thailandica]